MVVWIFWCPYLQTFWKNLGIVRSPPHLSADVLGLLWELVRVLLLVLTNSSVHLLPLDALLTLAKGRLALYHLEDQAAQPPPVWADGVALVLDHLGSWVRQEFWAIYNLNQSWWGGVENCKDESFSGFRREKQRVWLKEELEGVYPCIQQCLLSLVSSLLQGFEQRDPGLRFGCVLHNNQNFIIWLRTCRIYIIKCKLLLLPTDENIYPQQW